MKKVENRLFKYLKEYFTIYLTRQKNCSSHTIIACKQTWNIFLKYIRDTNNVKLEKINFDDITVKVVTTFLDKMEVERNWSVITRNHRLACIRSFFKYASNVEPILIVYYEQLKSIPLKKNIDKHHTMEFMSMESLKILLQQPDTSTKMGIRDLFFMVLMYDTVARDCEMLGMKLCDFNVKEKTVQTMMEHHQCSIQYTEIKEHQCQMIMLQDLLKSIVSRQKKSAQRCLKKFILICLGEAERCTFIVLECLWHCYLNGWDMKILKLHLFMLMQILR